MIQSDVNWIANNQASKNIAYVGQLGDITNASAASESNRAQRLVPVEQRERVGVGDRSRRS